MYCNIPGASCLLSHGDRPDLCDYLGNTTLERAKNFDDIHGTPGASRKDKTVLIDILTEAVAHHKLTKGPPVTRLTEAGNALFQCGEYEKTYELYTDSLTTTLLEYVPESYNLHSQAH